MKLKKLAAVFAALCMTVPLVGDILPEQVAIKVNADEEIFNGTWRYWVDGEDSSITIMSYVGDAGDEFIIPSEIDGLTVKRIAGYGAGAGAFAYHDFSSVIIPDSIIGIGDSVFEGCTNLTSIIIPDSVVGIGMAAFCDCSKLSSVTIGNHVEDIGYMAFKDCSSLTSVTLPASVSEIKGGAFADCTSLMDITILNPDCDMFYDSSTICNYSDDDYPETIFNGTIHGYANSTAQAYAEEYGYKFDAIDDTTTETALQPGDLNGDETIDIMDVILINKAIFGKVDLTDAQIKAADINGSGAPDSTDALTMMKYIIKLIDTLG